MESFWCKVTFKDFIKHFRKLSDSEILADIRESMDALEDGSEDGKSFGAMMVKSSNKRIEDCRKQRQEAGRNGGKARAEKFKKCRNQSGDARNESSTVSNGATDAGCGNVSGEHIPSDNNGCASESATSAAPKISKKKKCRPPSTEELYNFAEDTGLDESDARDCYEMCSSRNWTDRNGNNIVDWKSFTKGFCDSRRNKRRVS